MARNEPKVGTMGPVKKGGTGGGLSKAAVAEAMKTKPVPKVKGGKLELPKAQDTKRNAKAMRDM